MKVDLFAEWGKGTVGMIELASSQVGEAPLGMVAGGEAVFVPRDAAAMEAGTCAEDDGYLLLYTSQMDTSYCMVRIHMIVAAGLCLPGFWFLVPRVLRTEDHLQEVWRVCTAPCTFSLQFAFLSRLLVE